MWLYITQQLCSGSSQHMLLLMDLLAQCKAPPSLTQHGYVASILHSHYGQCPSFVPGITLQARLILVCKHTVPHSRRPTTDAQDSTGCDVAGFQRHWRTTPVVRPCMFTDITGRMISHVVGTYHHQSRPPPQQTTTNMQQQTTTKAYHH